MSKQIAEMVIESTKMEIYDTKTIKLKWPDNYNPIFKTGQFVTVFWPHKEKYKRAYSLSSCVFDRGFYEITIKRDGKMGTSLVDWADVGDKLGVIAPTGHFLPEDNKHLICIAGGSGITPFRGFARDIAIRKQSKLTILYSVKTANDIIFNNELSQLAADGIIEFKVTCTRDDNWGGRCGRITPDWILNNVNDLQDTVFYACGPIALVDFAERLVLKELGVSKSQLKLEKW